MMHEAVSRVLKRTVYKLMAEEKLMVPLELLPEGIVEPEVETPREEAHGDLASNIALQLAKWARQPPRGIAELIAGAVSDPIVKRVEIAGPGFLNFFLREEFFRTVVREVHLQGDRWGEVPLGRGRRVLIEFVSANPTGPLNVVNARAATIGDILANLFLTCGYNAEREYYVNDEGSQIENLGKSLYARYAELHGRPVPIPEDGYQGEYLIEIAKELMHGSRAYGAKDDWKGMAVSRLLEKQKESLKRFGVWFDRFFLQSDLTARGSHATALKRLKDNGFTYERDGAVWFATSRFGDEKDRVLVRQNGDHTYFSVDIAYHLDKAVRGYEILINFLGPDHHGYIPRLKAAIQALGYPVELLEVYIIQQVTLLQGGEPVKMSKRAGDFITMDEIIEEVGSDAARFFFNLRHRDSPLEFDLTLAKARNEDNPLYYVQYAHARIRSILRNAAEQGVAMPDDWGSVDVTPLSAREEIALIKVMSRFPMLVRQCLENREPHHLTAYAQELARAFHGFYTAHRVLGPFDLGKEWPDAPAGDPEELGRRLSLARLALIEGARLTIWNLLGLMGITAPDRM